jgi:hypothetical protein
VAWQVPWCSGKQRDTHSEQTGCWRWWAPWWEIWSEIIIFYTLCLLYYIKWERTEKKHVGIAIAHKCVFADGIGTNYDWVINSLRKYGVIVLAALYVLVLGTFMHVDERHYIFGPRTTSEDFSRLQDHFEYLKREGYYTSLYIHHLDCDQASTSKQFMHKSTPSQKLNSGYISDAAPPPSPCMQSDSCEWAKDGICDDGGSGSRESHSETNVLCNYGTDYTDCGERCILVDVLQKLQPTRRRMPRVLPPPRSPLVLQQQQPV